MREPKRWLQRSLLSKLSERIDINEGKTGANGLPAAFAGLIGVVLLTVNIWLSVVFFVICAIMSLVTEGLELDSSTKRYRKYYAIFTLKSGTWKKIPDAREVELKLNIRSFSVTRWLPAGPRDKGSVRERIMTFNVLLDTPNGQIIFYEFYRYKDARRALEAISLTLNIPICDHVQEKINER